MVAAVEQIERELKALEKSTEKIAQDLYNVYTSYLTLLGQAVRQQLILASYHLCTQRYPEQFLQLSFNQRQQLQQALQNLGRQAQQQITEQLPVLQKVLAPQRTDGESAEPSPEVPETDDLSASSPLGKGLAIALASQRLTPPQLLVLLEKLEHHHVEVLQGISQAGNHLLQQANILPQGLPEPVFAAAAKAGEVADVISSGPPNLLSMLVEIPDEDEDEAEDDASEEDKNPSITPLVAVHLRLSEIEFANSTLSAWRSKLRELMTQLERLGRQYGKKQQEREIAEAEAAWRASWFEE